jgi:CheY-like chemotaxis protein
MLAGLGFKLSILIAEDNAINQKVMLLMLKKLGHHADVVANGIEVLQALERHYDVVLMDIGMPEMDGLQATKYIRYHWPAREQPRIIAVTAYGMSNVREICLDAGMDDFISKPVQIEELKSAPQFVRRETPQNCQKCSVSPN